MNYYVLNMEGHAIRGLEEWGSWLPHLRNTASHQVKMTFPDTPKHCLAMTRGLYNKQAS
jgi:hypothetical protein